MIGPAVRLGLMTADGYAKVLNAAVDYQLHVSEDGGLDRVSHEALPSGRAERDRRVPCGAVVP